MTHRTAPLPVTSGPTWLLRLIDEAARQVACVRIGCTTCGATPFRKALWASAEAANPADPDLEIARQLAATTAAHPPETLRFVIHQLHRHAGEARFETLSRLFELSFAGQEHQGMRAHARSVAAQSLSNAYRNSPAFAAANRADRAARHAERLAAKAIRDAARRAERGD